MALNDIVSEKTKKIKSVWYFPGPFRFYFVPNFLLFFFFLLVKHVTLCCFGRPFSLILVEQWRIKVRLKPKQATVRNKPTWLQALLDEGGAYLMHMILYIYSDATGSSLLHLVYNIFFALICSGYGLLANRLN